MAAVFRNLLPAFFVHAYRTSQCSADAFAQLAGLLDLWVSRGIYPAAVIEAIKAEMLAVVRCS
jgi:CID domain